MKPTSLRIRLQDAAGHIYHWTLRRIPKVWGVNPDGPLSKGRYLSGWEYIDHDGYPRFQEGNWYDVLPRVRLTAENYGFTLLTELS